LQSLAALSLAVERRAALAPDEREDAAALVRALAPGMGEEAGAFAERRLIERAAEHARGLSVVAPTLGLRTPREVTPRDALLLARISPPAPTLAFAASSFGFVNFDADPDGSPRRMPPLKPSPMGELTQFGVAAACAFLGVRPADASIDDHSFVIEGRSLPLRGGQLLVSWPSPAAYRASSDERRMSLGVLVSLARNRATFERLRAQRVALAG